MTTYRGIGVALAIAGVVFLVMGLGATDSAIERVSETLTGKYTDQTVWYIAGGLRGPDRRQRLGADGAHALNSRGSRSRQ